MESMEADTKVLERSSPTHQESLQSEVVPDPMEGEQTWPTEEELAEADGASLSYGHMGGMWLWTNFTAESRVVTWSTIRFQGNVLCSI